jgi:predicted nucleotidyltransferase component of viral defense system
MIPRTEILELAKLFGLRANIVEKDYVLGWLLSEINQHRLLTKHWIFKGGTCLKKCYFETYRFSEDLDFTITDETHLNQDFLKATFAQVSVALYEKTGIEFPEQHISFELFINPRGKTAVLGKIGYIGPLEQRGSVARIKVDITHDEALILEPVRQIIHHPYSDEPVGGLHAFCYAFEEIFAEKTRALIERARPRDLYDVIHLYRNRELINNKSLLSSTLQKKCAFKQLPVPTFSHIKNHTKRAELDSEWESMLAHQLQTLPVLEQFWTELPLFFNWLHEAVESVTLQPAPIQSDHSAWTPGRVTGISWGSAYIEKIQFAAANRVCIRLIYSGESRLVEPYSFRKSKDNAQLFYGYHREDSQMKCFRLDKFQGLDVTREPFTPRYRVEISSVGRVNMPHVSLAATVQSREASTRTKSRTSPSRRKTSARNVFQQTFIFECPVCHKTFKRSKFDAKLNPHKGKAGYKCHGTVGWLKHR